MSLFLGLAILCTVCLVYTLRTHPLLPLRLNDNDWLRHWLGMTVIDYYGAALPLCAVVAVEEKKSYCVIAWCLSFLILGSPACCLYAVVYLYRRQNTGELNSVLPRLLFSLSTPLFPLSPCK